MIFHDLDMMINFALRSDPRKHVCELQIGEYVDLFKSLCPRNSPINVLVPCFVFSVHVSLLHTRKSLPGHVVYNRVRNANELLEYMAVPAEHEQRGEDCARRLMAKVTTPEQLSLMGFSNECISAGQLIADGRDPKALANASLEISWLAQCCTDQVNLSSSSLADLHGSALGKLMSDSLFVTVLNLSMLDIVNCWVLIVLLKKIFFPAKKEPKTIYIYSNSSVQGIVEMEFG